jgi:hypothetical protein
MVRSTGKRIMTRSARGTIGVLVFLSGLLLLCTSAVGIVMVRGDGGSSVEGLLVIVGVLGLACSGLYFLWIGYSILIRKRITGISLSLLSVIPALLITMFIADFIERFWEKPSDGYSFFHIAVLSTLTMIVFVGLCTITLRALVRLFRKGNAQ